MVPESPWLLPAAGALTGLVMGAFARWNHFCTLSALERHWYADDSSGLRTWILAAAVALLTTQLAIYFGALDVSNSFYLGSGVQLIGAVVGGILFGVGMAFVGTCGFGALVRLGGGSLRSLIVVVAIGLAALTAQRGLIGRLRLEWLEPLSVNVPGSSQSIADIISTVLHLPLQLPLALLFAAGLFYWIFSSASFRTQWRNILTGCVIGLCVTIGWLCTWHLSEILYRQVQIESASFVMPPGDLVFSLIAATGVVPDFGVGMVVGVVFGAAIAAKVADQVSWEACDDARELSRHLLGAFMMGTGGVLAAGCTVGQGISAMSTMAVSAPIVFISICVGAKLGLRYLLEGQLLVFGR